MLALTGQVDSGDGMCTQYTPYSPQRIEDGSRGGSCLTFAVSLSLGWNGRKRFVI